MRLQNFGADKSLEQDGNWINIGGDQWLLIARLGNPRYAIEFQRLLKPHIKEIRRADLPKGMLELQKKALAKTILLGWEGLKDDKGQLVEFSPDMALECLIDNQDFFELVQSLAEDRENFQERQEAEGLGN